MENLDEEHCEMPNFFSAFTSEVFRPLVTLLIPGAIAISTWFVGFLWRFPDLRRLVSNNPGEAVLLLVLAMTFAGLTLEDMGARVETWLDTNKNKQDGKHLANWYAYLRTAFVADPIGRRYIRTLVLRLKFELGTVFAMSSAGTGVLWLWYLGLNCTSVFVTELACVLFGAGLLWEAWSTHDTLAKNRANLLEEIRIVPPPPNTDAR
jgi:hypothetical protein